MLARKKWKKKNQQKVSGWLRAIIQTEVSPSFATLAFNNTDWVYPEFVETHFTLKGNNIGHPLIAKQKRG
jgi:hypothetical protein